MTEKLGTLFHDWREVTLLAVLTGTPVLAVLALVPAARDTTTAPRVAAAVAGVMLLLAATLAYLHWREHPTIQHGWAVAASIVIVVQVASGAGFALAPALVAQERGWGAYVDAASAVLALGLIVLGRRADRVLDPLLLGVGLGLLLTGVRALALVSPDLQPREQALAHASMAVTATAYAGIARMLLTDRTLPRWGAEHLAVAVGLVGIGVVVRSWPGAPTAAGLTAAVALGLAAALWTGATYVLLQEGHDSDRGRSADLERSQLEAEAEARDARERLHEVRNTLAGLASASRLLFETPLPAPTRHRLERSLHAELMRLERLLVDGAAHESRPVHLDEALDVLLDAHRARGRTIDWKPSGACVQCDPDDLTEVINILLENAAKHATGSASRIEVTSDETEVEIAVSDEGPGVPREIRELIFDWGGRGGAAPGEGIGLHLARRLVTQHGGSLTLSERPTQGSSFVVRLPAVRRSDENGADG